MDINHIVIDDENRTHRELSIYRTGEIHLVRLTDKEYRTYGTLEISAHDHSALFHFGIVEALNELPFISETGHGLDSWDEAFLHRTSIAKMLSILDRCKASIEQEKEETVLLGWHDKPVPAAYWRKIEPRKFLHFTGELQSFAEKALAEEYDLEFIL